MGYESEIQFTLDTICPWTYLAKRRLDKALATVPSDCPVTFKLKYMPYQLFPEASQEGEDKFAWYMRAKYDNSQDKMDKYVHLMTTYGEGEGIHYKFGGTVANTMHAHRLIQHFQATKGPEVANKIVNSLYRQYFEEEQHPSADETLLRAATDAGVDESEATAFIEDRDEGLMQTKMLVRAQASNQIDAVPYVVIEGKRRDLQLEGAKEMDEYVSALNKIIKESS